MSGTITLSLTQQWDKVTHQLLEGGKVYFYSANTTTPLSAFQSPALTLAYPNPITLESDGRIPNLWFADSPTGVRCRITNAAGVLQLDVDNLQVYGSSAGGAPAVDTTDVNALFTTGMVMWMPWQSAKTGWLRCNGLTLGAVGSSAASESALNQALYQFLWNNMSGPTANALCPVIGGLGATALADWGAPKAISNLDLRGRGLFGLDDMGAAAASRINAALFAAGGPTVPGANGGADRNTLLLPHLPPITPAGTVDVTIAPHHHSIKYSTAPQTGSSTQVLTSLGSGPNAGNSDDTIATATATFTGVASNGGAAAQPHNTMSPFMLGSFYIRI